MEIFNTFSNLLLKKNLIFNILSEIIFIGITIILLQKIFRAQFSRKNIFIYIAINTLCFIFSTLLIPQKFARAFTLVSSMILSIYLLKISTLKSLTYFSIQSIIILNLTFCIFKPLCHISTLAHYSEVFELPIFNIASFALIASIGFIIHLLTKHLEFDSLLQTTICENSKLIIANSIINLIVAYSIFYSFFEVFIENLAYILLIDMYFYFSISHVIYCCHKYYLNQKLTNVQLCNKTILALHDDTRAFKHDFHNIIQAIGGYIYTNDLSGLKKYYKEVLGDCHTVNNLSKLTPTLINNPAVYSILADKFFIANKNNIQMNFDVMTDLNELNINVYELTRILGILLDNAIEASKECATKNINILFKKDNKKKMLIIENTYKNKQISIDKIFEKDYSTKPNNTGLGLWEVRRILNKHNNLNLHTTKNECYFSQQLEIYA